MKTRATNARFRAGGSSAGRGRGDPSFAFGLGALVLVSLLIGIRVGETVRDVLGGPRSASSAFAALSPPAIAPIDTASAPDAVPLRDPFRRETPAPKRRPVDPAPTKPPVLPTLRSLLFDETNPTVQIMVGAAVSGWLRPGETFQGWQILEIGPTSVRVANNGRMITLALS